MAMTGVLRPGHAQIRVLDMDESVQFCNYSPQFQVPHHDSAETRLRRCALECGYK